jgi:hypothetical protein
MTVDQQYLQRRPAGPLHTGQRLADILRAIADDQNDTDGEPRLRRLASAMALSGPKTILKDAAVLASPPHRRREWGRATANPSCPRKRSGTGGWKGARAWAAMPSSAACGESPALARIRSWLVRVAIKPSKLWLASAGGQAVLGHKQPDQSFGTKALLKPSAKSHHRYRWC